MVTLVLLTATAMARASSCSTEDLTSFVGLGSAGCSVSVGTTGVTNLVSNFTTTVSSSVASGISIGSNTANGGLNITIPLSDFAGMTAGQFANFTFTAPAGFNITDVSAKLSSSGSVTGTASFLLGNEATDTTLATANLGGSSVNAMFGGVSSFTVDGDITVSAGATGTATLMITPSLTPASTVAAVPEPASFTLLGVGLLAAGFLLRHRRRWA